MNARNDLMEERAQAKQLTKISDVCVSSSKLKKGIYMDGTSTDATAKKQADHDHGKPYGMILTSQLHCSQAPKGSSFHRTILPKVISIFPTG